MIRTNSVFVYFARIPARSKRGQFSKKLDSLPCTNKFSWDELAHALNFPIRDVLREWKLLEKFQWFLHKDGSCAPWTQCANFKKRERRRATYERKREAIVFPTFTSKRGGACVVIIFLFALVHAAFRVDCRASCPYFARALIKRRVLLLYKMLRLVHFRRPLAIISRIRTGFTSSTSSRIQPDRRLVFRYCNSVTASTWTSAHRRYAEETRFFVVEASSCAHSRDCFDFSALASFAEPGEAGSREKRRACVVNGGGGKLLTRCVGVSRWMNGEQPVNKSGPGKQKRKNHYEPREQVNEVNTHEWHCSCSFSCVQWITRIGLVETRNTQPTTRRWLWTRWKTIEAQCADIFSYLQFFVCLPEYQFLCLLRFVFSSASYSRRARYFLLM